MSKFFDPPQAKPLIAKEKIDKVFKSMRFRVFMGSFLGYAAYYLVRKNLSLASADMIAEGLIDKQGVGIAASAVSIAYAFSKFIMGTLSDRSDARKFLSIGLVIASLVMMSVGFLPFSATNMAFNVAMLFVIMLFVGCICIRSSRCACLYLQRHILVLCCRGRGVCDVISGDCPCILGHDQVV